MFWAGEMIQWVKWLYKPNNLNLDPLNPRKVEAQAPVIPDGRQRQEGTQPPCLHSGKDTLPQTR